MAGASESKIHSTFTFDEVSATFAYFGDILTPNFLTAGERLKENNYRQVLAEKHFGSRVKAFIDYT